MSVRTRRRQIRPPVPVDYRRLVMRSIPREALISYWPLDGGEGGLNDQTARHNATNSSTTISPDLTPRVRGGSRLFNGAMNITAATPLGGVVWTGALIRPTASEITAGNGGISGKWLSNNGALLYTGASGALSLAFGGAGVTSATGVLKADTWHAVMMLSVSGRRHLFCDGVRVATNATAGGHGTTGSTSWEIGTYANGNAATRFEGNIAHVWVATDSLGAAAPSNLEMEELARRFSEPLYR